MMYSIILVTKKTQILVFSIKSSSVSQSAPSPVLLIRKTEISTIPVQLVKTLERRTEPTGHVSQLVSDSRRDHIYRCFTMYFFFMLPLLIKAQEDPCTPNPCGENTRCASSFSGSNPVISCECLLGYYVPDGGDPFDGCLEQLLPGGTSRGSGNPLPSSSSHKPPTEAPIIPLSTQSNVEKVSTEKPISEEPRALENDESVNRLQAGQRPGQQVPRRKVKPTNDFEDVDTKELFPEGDNKFTSIG